LPDSTQTFTKIESQQNPDEFVENEFMQTRLFSLVSGFSGCYEISVSVSGEIPLPKPYFSSNSFSNCCDASRSCCQDSEELVSKIEILKRWFIRFAFEEIQVQKPDKNVPGESVSVSDGG
jgi:hypothetical protein